MNITCLTAKLNSVVSNNIAVAYNQRLCFDNANFGNCVYVQLHNTQTSVCVTVKIVTPSAFSIKMQIKNYCSLEI